MSDIRRHSYDIKSAYKENEYPSDRLIADLNAIRAFTQEVNSRTGGSYSITEVAHELQRIRKDKLNTGGLPRVGRAFIGPKFI